MQSNSVSTPLPWILQAGPYKKVLYGLSMLALLGYALMLHNMAFTGLFPQQPSTAYHNVWSILAMLFPIFPLVAFRELLITNRQAWFTASKVLSWVTIYAWGANILIQLFKELAVQRLSMLEFYPSAKVATLESIVQWASYIPPIHLEAAIPVLLLSLLLSIVNREVKRHMEAGAEDHSNPQKIWVGIDVPMPAKGVAYRLFEYLLFPAFMLLFFKIAHMY